MINKIIDTIKGTKTEHDKNKEELQLTQGAIAELNSKLGKFQVILQGAQLELELGEDAGTKKRIAKIEAGIDKVATELSELKNRAEELQTAIDTEVERQRVERLREASQADAKLYAQYIRAVMLSKELEKLSSVLEARNGGTFDPVSLRSELGLSYGVRLNAEAEEMLDEEIKTLRAQAEKEVDEIVSKVRKATGLDR